MPKNYYVILGVPSSSTIDDIKSAYRKLAKEFHPDYYDRSHDPFLAIQEAYSVLSDPVSKKRYDQSIDNVRVNNSKRKTARPYHPSHHHEAEPLIPEERFAEPLGNVMGSARRSSWSHPMTLFDQFFDRATENWKYQTPRKDRTLVAISLTDEQAQRGGHVHVNLPAQIRCPDCNGSGGIAYECWRCFGDGLLRGEIPLLLSYPAGVEDKHTVELSLQRHGLPGVSLAVIFNVSGSG